MNTRCKTSGYIIRSAAVAILLLPTLITLISAFNFPNSAPGSPFDPSRKGVQPAKQAKTLTFVDRVAYQRAIEEVYWRHRIWPKGRPDPKPPLDAVMSREHLEKKVDDYLHNSLALEDYWQRPLTAEDLQAEMDRMASNTKHPEVLHELFEALENDPFLIAECLARPVLSERLITGFSQEQREVRLALSEVGANSQTRKLILANSSYTLPAISGMGTGCTPDTWTAISTTNAPVARDGHTAVWTGSEMIVWGGFDNGTALDTGGRYDPMTDSWTATSTTNAPTARAGHTAVWSGNQMIVWGGQGIDFYNTGGRYDSITDSWAATSTTNAPDARDGHAAVWTGSEMIVWGGVSTGYFNTGGRYNPTTDSWIATSTTNAPDGRCSTAAVWSGSEMIVWGGSPDCFDEVSNTGGRYNPGSDSWRATSTRPAPDARDGHTLVWTGSEMIVWGGYTGFPGFRPLDTGGRYNASSNSWTETTTIGAPDARGDHTAVWTGSEMIVWGGEGTSLFNTGARYCAESSEPTPTPTPTATPSSTPRTTPTPRLLPTPRPRLTPVPRP